MRRTPLIVILTLAVAAAVVAGCGSSDDSDDSSNANAGSSTSCVTEAKAAADKAQRPVTLPVPTESVDMSALQGKSVWFIQPVPSDFETPYVEAFKQAAEAAGLKPTVFNAQGQQNLFSQGLQQAVAAHADGIVLGSIDPESVAGPLAAAVNAGIPVIDSFQTDPDDPLAKGISAHVTADYTAMGAIQADWVMSQTDCKSNAVMEIYSGFQVLSNWADGAQSEFDRLCGSDCNLQVEQFPPTQQTTQATSRVSTALLRDPDINYLMAGQGNLTSFMLTAVNQSGKDVPVAGANGVPANLDGLRNGTGEKADLAFPPPVYAGYLTLDTLARVMLDQPPTDLVIPTRLITSSNIGSSNTNLLEGGQPEQFLKIWGVG